MPVSLTAALQFLPTRMDRRFLSPAPYPRWSGAAMVVRRPHHAGIGVADALVPDFRNPPCSFRRTSRSPRSRSRRPSQTSARRCKSPIARIPDHLRSGLRDDAALVRSVLLQRCAAAGRRIEVSGAIMTQGIKRSCYGLRQWPLIALLFGLPAFSMTSELAVEPPAPSISQCALIEVHDTAGIGWWSSAALEIDPAAAVYGGD